MNERRIDRWFAHYSGDHRNETNQRIHVVAVPLILWSVVALLWCIPVAGAWFRPGLWAALAMFFAWSFYFRSSQRLGYGMLVVFVLMAWATRWLHETLGTAQLLCLAIGGAWLAALIGTEKGWALGVAPFVLGAFLKSALAAAVLKGIRIHGGRNWMN